MTSRLDLVLAAGKAHAASTGGHAQSHPQAMEHAREMHGLTDLIVNKAIGLHTFRQAFDPDSRLPRRRDAMFRKGVTTTHARWHLYTQTLRITHRGCSLRVPSFILPLSAGRPLEVAPLCSMLRSGTRRLFIRLTAVLPVQRTMPGLLCLSFVFSRQHARP